MSTTNYFRLADPAVAIEEWVAPASLLSEPAIALRRAAIFALDPMVRRAISRLHTGIVPMSTDLTIYTAIFPATPAIGGHWTVASRWIGPLAHMVGSYAICVAFDAQHWPKNFVLSGAREVATPDAGEAALLAAVELVRAAGPARTVAPHVFQRTGL